jgi:hypothetical protein
MGAAKKFILLEKDTKFDKLDDQMLEFQHFLLHQWYRNKFKSAIPEDWTLEEIEEKHNEAHKELRKGYSKPIPAVDMLDIRVDE